MIIGCWCLQEHRSGPQWQKPDSRQDPSYGCPRRCCWQEPWCWSSRICEGFLLYGVHDQGQDAGNAAAARYPEWNELLKAVGAALVALGLISFCDSISLHWYANASSNTHRYPSSTEYFIVVNDRSRQVEMYAICLGSKRLIDATATSITRSSDSI